MIKLVTLLAVNETERTLASVCQSHKASHGDAGFCDNNRMESIYQDQNLPCHIRPYKGKWKWQWQGLYISSSRSPAQQATTSPPLSPSSIRNVSRKPLSYCASPRGSQGLPTFSPSTAVLSESLCCRCLTPPCLQMPSCSSFAPWARVSRGTHGKMKRKKWKGSPEVSPSLKGKKEDLLWFCISLLFLPTLDWSVLFSSHSVN